MMGKLKRQFLKALGLRETVDAKGDIVLVGVPTEPKPDVLMPHEEVTYDRQGVPAAAAPPYRMPQ